MILNESYTLNEIQDRITDTRNILSALRDSLYILSSALENPDEQREEYEDLAYNVDKYYIGDIESMIGDFERDSKGIEELEESLHEDVFKEWKPDLRFKHIQSILDAALKRGKYVNNERDEVMAALDRADEGGYTPEQRKFIKDKHAEMWRKNKNEDLNESTKLDTIKTNKKSYMAVNKYIDTIEDEFEKAIYKHLILRWLSGNNWLGGISDSVFQKVYDKYFSEYPFDMVHDKFDEILNNKFDKNNQFLECITEDTIKTKDGKWVNKGDTGETHGEFKTKKEADAQRKAIFASGWKK